ncbi:glycerate kinase type-2 family protein [Thiorhodococcus fuscus]|uniref:Glycerate kinase n=1 Tax=Thiorhodococcus fuscus TaxID=527200 RepID=A0ABW4Y704_9GAMM
MSNPRPMHTAPNPPIQTARARLLDCFAAAIAAVDGREATRRALTRRPIEGPIWLYAIGKAAASMALGATETCGDACLGGLVVTKPGHADRTALAARGIECLFGGHPLPDQSSLDAGERLMAALDDIPSKATQLFLISGGASSLIDAPIQGIDLPELRRINAWLLSSGLPIEQINRVRKSISRIKGGGLLSRVGDRPLRALAISDVPGDDPSVIGSGPLSPEPDLGSRVLELPLPDWLGDRVRRGLAERGRSPARGPTIELIADIGTAMQAAAERASQLGLSVRLHPPPIQGDAAEQGRTLARTLIDAEPGLHIWGGETTVALPDTPGRGGRNQHLALAAAIALAGHPECLLLSAGTDGTDGPTEDAGALVDAWTLERAAVDGFDAESTLIAANSGQLLEASGDLIRTGPTDTNVMDLILGLKL